MSTDPNDPNFSYKNYSLQQLDNWVNDAINCEDLTPEDIYNTIVKCVDESVEYHRKHLNKGVEILSLLKGHREVNLHDEDDIQMLEEDYSYNMEKLMSDIRENEEKHSYHYYDYWRNRPYDEMNRWRDQKDSFPSDTITFS